MGAVQRELMKLTAAGIIRRESRGNQVYYQANPNCPVYSELKGLVLKTLGAGDVLRAGLAPLAERIELAFVFGSVAGGREGRESDVDLLVVGKVTFAEVVAAVGSAQKTLGREINPAVYPVKEFGAKAGAGHYFLKRVLQGPRLWIIGGEGELARLAPQRLGR
jgi:predicted nucleotidyltransferase